MEKNDTKLKIIYKSLKRLFSTGTIVKQIGGKKLVVKDLDTSQAYNSLRDRYQKLYLKQYRNIWRPGTALDRRLRYIDYEAMDRDSLCSSVLDIYAEESGLINEEGDILSITSENENIVEILTNLFYDILNIEFNFFHWVRNLVKYGDFFLLLDIDEEYGIKNVVPYSIYEMEREEGYDENNPYAYRFILLGDRQTPLENFQVAHFRLLNDTVMLPYGRSILEPGRRIWKQLQLMEDAMLVYRIMRAPERRIFYINVGGLPPDEVDNFMNRVVSKIKKAPVIDPATGDFNLRYNIQNIAEDFFFPVRGGEGGESTRVETLPGGQNTGDIDDINYLLQKLFAAFKVPKSFLQYEQDLSQKSTLAYEDIRFSRSIERIQRVVESELTKIAIIHLYVQGFRNEDLVNFELKLTNSSTIREQQKLDFISKKIDISKSAVDSELFDKNWVYKNIWMFSDDEIEKLDNTKNNDNNREESNNDKENNESDKLARDTNSIEYDNKRVMGYKPTIFTSYNPDNNELLLETKAEKIIDDIDKWLKGRKLL